MMKRIADLVKIIKSPCPLKHLCLAHIYTKIKTFFCEIEYKFNEKKELVLSTVNTIKRMDKINIDNVYSHTIDALFEFLINIIQPRNLFKKYIDFIKNLNLPENIFDNQFIDSGNSLTCIFKRYSYRSFIGELITRIFYTNNLMADFKCSFLDKKYFSYIHNFLKVRNLKDLENNLEDLLNLDEVTITKILFSLENPFLNFVLGNFHEISSFDESIYEVRIGSESFLKEITKKWNNGQIDNKVIYNQTLNILEFDQKAHS